MGLFSFFKKSTRTEPVSTDPYKESSLNFIYNLLFCDNMELFKIDNEEVLDYPYDILFSNNSTIGDLKRITEDGNLESRVKILAYNQLLLKNIQPTKKELLGIIIEVGSDIGLDVLASYNDGTARYINKSEKIIVWETTDQKSIELKNVLFKHGQSVVEQLGPWDEDRLPFPKRGNARITFLVSDGLYFGEGPINALFSDPLAKSTLISGTELMQYLTEKSLEEKK